MAVSPAVVRRQRLLLTAAYRLGRVFAWAGRRVSWIVGAEEIAGMVSDMSHAVAGSLTIVRAPHRFYDVGYDIVLQRPESRWEKWRRLYLGAVALGWWAARARGVIYVGAAGFLDGPDEREHEFRFLREHGRAVVCCFTGTDIRSPALMAAAAERTGLANIGSIQRAQGEPYASDEYEEVRRRRADVADRYASAVITARVDQLSYLTGRTEPFLYFAPDERFVGATAKFADLGRIVVLHAPSNPLLKGTDTVRAVMERIVERFPHVEYRELDGVPNAEVIAALDAAHIVVNQLHAQMPGVFGIEAMARRAVMVCSADPAVETDLVDAEGAWVVANPDDLEDRIAALVSDPGSLEAQATRGWRWARAHASAAASGESLRAILQRAAP